MENIKCFENFLQEDDMKTCNQFLNTPNWLFGNKSDIFDKTSIKFWHLNLDENDFFSIYLKYKIEVATGKKFALKTVYANGQTFGQDGSFHKDSVEDNHWTFCLYICQFDDNPINMDSIGGNIQFKMPEMKPFLINIEPLSNRAILFPSNYLHRGLSFNRFISELRICVAWKLREIN